MEKNFEIPGNAVVVPGKLVESLASGLIASFGKRIAERFWSDKFLFLETAKPNGVKFQFPVFEKKAVVVELKEKEALEKGKNWIAACLEPIPKIYPSRVCSDFLSSAMRDEEVVPTERRDAFVVVPCPARNLLVSRLEILLR